MKAGNVLTYDAEERLDEIMAGKIDKFKDNGAQGWFQVRMLLPSAVPRVKAVSLDSGKAASVEFCFGQVAGRQSRYPLLSASLSHQHVRCFRLMPYRLFAISSLRWTCV